MVKGSGAGDVLPHATRALCKQAGAFSSWKKEKEAPKVTEQACLRAWEERGLNVVASRPRCHCVCQTGGFGAESSWGSRDKQLRADRST